MNRSLRRTAVILLVCILAVAARPARGQIGISGGQAAGIGIVIGGVLVGLGVAAYFAFRHPPTITGCAFAAGNGLTLASEGDHQTYFLIGDTAAIKPGDRVKIKGKTQKKDAAGNRPFLVSDLKKDYGACSAQPTAPVPPPRR